MKITSFILYTFLLLKTNNCLAQKDTAAEKKFDRFYISLTGGVGVPVGEFAEFNIPAVYPIFAPVTTFYSIAGEARAGLTGKLNGYYFFSKRFGCVATVYAGTFKAKEKTLGQLIPQPLYTIENVTSAYKTKSWTAGGAMVGMIASVPVSEVIFSIRLLGGLQRSVSPETNLTETRSSIMTMKIITQNYTQPPVSSVKFALDAGLDMRIKTGKKINILVSADFISTTSKASFNDSTLVETEIDNYYHSGNPPFNYEGSMPFSETKQISFFSLTAGIAYVFK